MSNSRSSVAGLSIEAGFRQFIEEELLPAVGIASGPFWQGLASLSADLKPLNRQLLAKRDEIQLAIDEFHRQHAGEAWNGDTYETFLRDIGYLVPRGPDFSIETDGVDREIAKVAGPQLVVPVSNARFALNAANARWVSLYDALYGTDVIDASDGKAAGSSYNPARGAAVIEYAYRFLDDAFPLARGSYSDLREIRVDTDDGQATVRFIRNNGEDTTLKDPARFRGFRANDSRVVILLRHNGLHVELRVDPDHPVGKEAPGHIADVVMEAAITTIQDCEDSVAAVDSADKTGVYRNWFGLMQGDLEIAMHKDGKRITRRLAEDRRYTGTDGKTLTLPGRSLMLVRNVGHLMQTDAIIDADGDEIFEGILDAVVTVAAALNDLRGSSRLSNSLTGSIYIVKPKMHGPDEAAFADNLMSRVEDLLGLDRHTIKIGVMDEERRTTVNLAECIRAVRHRLVFINTGFLDRTGDEIHTSMLAGPVLRKEAIKQQPWIKAYEDWNVDIGIRCGLPGKAQIGKGMWPKTDEMREMVETKGAQLEAGASCAWVPSPTAAALHAMHYHKIDVAARQEELASRPLASFEDILTPPLGDPGLLSPREIEAELENNAQGILGYVVRWIDQGIGCSKVPDIDGVDLMEDRATLRISSQHIANWLEHGVCSREQVRKVLERMAAVVDKQNAGDPAYEPMAPDPDASIAFRAAAALVFEGKDQPNGYTEPLLHQFRRDYKASPGQ